MHRITHIGIDYVIYSLKGQVYNNTVTDYTAYKALKLANYANYRQQSAVNSTWRRDLLARYSDITRSSHRFTSFLFLLSFTNIMCLWNIQTLRKFKNSCQNKTSDNALSSYTKPNAVS